MDAWRARSTCTCTSTEMHIPGACATKYLCITLNPLLTWIVFLSLHLAVFYNILSDLFVCQPARLNCKHPARLADSTPKGASTHTHTHTLTYTYTHTHARMCTRHTHTQPHTARACGVDEKWPFCALFYFPWVFSCWCMHSACVHVWVLSGYVNVGLRVCVCVWI